MIVARSSVAKRTYLNSGVKKTMTAAFLPRHQKSPLGSPRRDGLVVTPYGERPREAGARYDRSARWRGSVLRGPSHVQDLIEQLSSVLLQEERVRRTRRNLRNEFTQFVRYFAAEIVVDRAKHR